MGRAGTLDSRLKKIRKELSLIDKDLQALSDVASNPQSTSPKPKLRSRQLRQEEKPGLNVERKQRKSPKPANAARQSSAKDRPAARESVLVPKGTEDSNKDDRFLDYLSSSFNSDRPLGQERRIQRNKAILMLVVVLFILFLVLYRMRM